MFTFEQLHYAWLQIRSGSKSAGIDGIPVELFESNYADELRNIEYQINRENYNSSPAKGFYISKKMVVNA